MEKQELSFRIELRSFRHAVDGCMVFFRKERNARIHGLATILVAVASWRCHVSRQEVAILTIVVGIVWIAEMFNSCVEKLIDFITTAQHPELKFVKDLAAGAVLLAAGTALAAGSIIFLPKIL